MRRAWRYLYGEHPLHLLALLASFALAGYVVTMVVDDPSAWWLLVWFVGAVIAHDLVLYPVYAFADQPLVILRWARRRVAPARPPLVPAVNHVRLPVLGSAVLGLIYLPTITRHGGDAFAFTAGHALGDQFQDWLLITGVLFGVSAVLYALRLGRAVGRTLVSSAHPAPSDPAPSAHPAESDDPGPSDDPTESFDSPVSADAADQNRPASEASSTRRGNDAGPGAPEGPSTPVGP